MPDARGSPAPPNKSRHERRRNEVSTVGHVDASLRFCASSRPTAEIEDQRTAIGPRPPLRGSARRSRNTTGSRSCRMILPIEPLGPARHPPPLARPAARRVGDSAPTPRADVAMRRASSLPDLALRRRVPPPRRQGGGRVCHRVRSCEQVFQAFPSPVRPPLRRPLGHAQGGGRLGIAIPLQVAQDHGGAMVRRHQL